MRLHPSTPLTASIALLALLVVFSCQRVETPRIELSQSQWQEVQTHLLDERPEPDHEIGAIFDDDIELLGVDVEGDFVTGEQITLTWYWHVLDDIDQDWQIFVHFDSLDSQRRQNLDHYPLGEQMDNSYRTYHWQEGHILADTQQFTIYDDYPSGDAALYVGLFRGDRRATATLDGDVIDGNRAVGPTFTITGSDAGQDAAAPSPTTATPTTHTIPRLVAEDVEQVQLDGRLDEEFWSRISSFRLQSSQPGASKNGIIQAAYTEEGLLIGATLGDKDVWATKEEPDTELWKEESFEIYISSEAADGPYIEVQINPLGAVSGRYFESPPLADDAPRRADSDRGISWQPESLQSAVHVEGDPRDRSEATQYWGVELLIPFQDLPGGERPEESDSWHINIVRVDRPDDETEHFYSWSTAVDDNHHLVQRFNQWKFGPTIADSPPIRQISGDDHRQVQEAIRMRMNERR